MRTNLFSIIVLILFASTLYAQDWKSKPGYNKFTHEDKDLWTKNQGEDIKFLLGVYKEDDGDISKTGFIELIEGGSGKYYWSKSGFKTEGSVLENHFSNWGFVVNEDGSLKKTIINETLTQYELYFEVKEHQFGAYDRNWEFTWILEYPQTGLLVISRTHWVKKK